MPVRKAISEKEGVYFITFTCTNWLPLFKIRNAYDAVFAFFTFFWLDPKEPKGQERKDIQHFSFPRLD
jgi:hypothetical protein